MRRCGWKTPVTRATLFCLWTLAGCASSGDVEQTRHESEQAKAKMRAELQQERALASSMAQESEARKAEADKLAKALGGGATVGAAAAKPRMGAALSAMSLTAALQTSNCLDTIAAHSPNPAVPQALFIGGTLPTKGGNSACTSVTIGTTDTTPFTAGSPLIPVVVGSGGTLTLTDPGAGSQMTLYASSFLIQSTGIMSAGSVSTPVAGQITIVMAGNASAALAPRASGSSSIVTASNTAPNSRDITVMDGGVLAFYGGKGLSAAPDGTQNNPASNPAFINTLYGTKSWTYLAAPAGPAKYNDAENVSAPVPATNPDTVITLANTVDWQVNDWISVATTSFSSHQTEIVQICGIASVANPETTLSGVPVNVSQLTLCNKLKHYHYGGLAPTPGFFPANTTQVVAQGGAAINVSFQGKSFYDDHRRNYGIDERAEVALLSRNIKLTSVAGQSADPNNFIGGHLAAMVTGTTAPSLTLVGVEIEKFGQALVGRYPVHLHQLPTGSPVLIQDVSVHHSYNKCYVVHGTANANLYNNVCVRTVGQGVYLEDGTGITGNQFIRNFIAGTMAAQTTYSYPRLNGSVYWDGDNLQGSYYSTPAQPWYQNAQWYTINGIADTSASGANGSIGPDTNFPGGFWVTNLGNTFVNNSIAGCQAQGRGYWLLTQNGQRYAYPEFTGNRAHGCYNGFDANVDTVNATNPAPTMNGTANDHAPVVLLNDNTVTRSRNRSFWGRGIFFTLHNNRFATNPYGFALLGGGGPEGNLPGFWGMAHENVIAGMTRNNVERYPGGCYFTVTKAQSTNGAPSYTPVTTSPSYTVITTPNAPPTGTKVQITGVQGSITANGVWTVTNIDATRFMLQLPFNYGTYTGGGMWQYSTGLPVPALQMECTDVALTGNLWGNYPSSNMNIQGYSYYDGPARIEHNRFVNFRFDPTGIHPNDPAARLLTKTDIQIIATYGTQGQLEAPLQSPPSPAVGSASYQGYAGDPATGWIQSNAQAVPPTQYIQNSVWDNVDFRHQVYTEAVNMGVFNDGDKTTVILDKDGQLTGLKVVDGKGKVHQDVVPVSLNNLDYYATDFTVDEPHSRGPNDFRSTSLMSPHGYATLNVESVVSPAGGTIPTPFRVVIQRDMPTYGDTVYPSLFLNGRGQNPIYEPFVMDRMGYTVFGMTGTENEPATQSPTSFQPQLLFSYTDPPVKKTGEYIVNRIAVYQPLGTPANIKMYRIRRQWGQQYTGQMWPPGYNPPGPDGFTCDGPFFANQGGSVPATRWTDCLARGQNAAPPQSYPGSPTQYSGGMAIPAATSWSQFEQPFKTLLAIKSPTAQDIATFIASQTYYYDSTNKRLYFYMIEEQPVQRGYAPYGTCNAAQYSTYVQQIQGIKSFSDPNSVQAALDASCLVTGGTPQQNDLFTCGPNGCAAYMVDLSTAVMGTPAACPSPCTPPHPISRADYSGWNQYTLVYGTPAQQPNGLPVVANAAIGNSPPPADGTALTGPKTPTDGTPPPSGDQVTYSFLPLSGAAISVTENFRYRCLTTPPWAPVNARGAYPPAGGFTYPLAESVCTMPHSPHK